MSWRYRITRKRGKVVRVARVSGHGGESFVRSRYNYHGKITNVNKVHKAIRRHHSRSRSYPKAPEPKPVLKPKIKSSTENKFRLKDLVFK